MNPTPHNWKEARRWQAWHLKQKGWPQRPIAEALGVSAAAQLAKLPALLRRGPDAYGFRGQVWTRKRVAEVMRLEFAIVYYPSHIGRLLKALRLPQASEGLDDSLMGPHHC